MKSAATLSPLDRFITVRRRGRLRRGLYLAVIVGLLAVALQVTVIADTDWERIGTPAQIMSSVGRFLAVDFGLVPQLLVPALETFMMACLGTLLGVVISLPVAWFGALNITPFKPVSYPLARFLMTLSRSIHEVVWALIFVAAVGLGSLPGILAIAMRSVGFISKITAEAIENVDPKPVEAIRAVGGNAFQVTRFAILPQVLPVVLGTIIFEWDINIRRSAVMGLVGAGGLGLTFFRQMAMYNYAGVTTVILAILCLIILGEVVSYYVRKAVI